MRKTGPHSPSLGRFRFAAGAGRECGHDVVGAIAQESHRAVGEREVRAAGVRTPEVSINVYTRRFISVLIC